MRDDRLGRQRVTEAVLVGVEEDTGLVVISCTSVGLEREDVGADEVLELEVSRLVSCGCRVGGSVETFDCHGGDARLRQMRDGSEDGRLVLK